MIRTTQPVAVSIPKAAAGTAAAPYGYSNLPGSIANWTAYKAPTTNDTVYFGQLSSGNYAYVGPDNQPYTGTKNDFIFGPGGTVMPVIGEATPVSWSGLGVANANPDVYESTYTGPNADSQAQNDAAYEGLVTSVPGETLVSNSASLLNGAGGVAGATGTIPTPPPPATTPGSSLSASTPVTATGSSTAGTTGTTSQSDPNNLSGSPAIGASDPYQTAFDSLIGQLTGNTAGASQGVPGSGSIAAGLPTIEQTPTSTTSTGSPLIIILLVGGLAVVGIWWWLKHRKKGGEAQEGSAEEKAA